MDKLREKYEKITKKKAPLNMSKMMLEKYITWHEQVKNHELKELQSLLRCKNSVIIGSNGTKLVREYQGKKYEVTIINDGGSHSSYPNGCFFYGGVKYKSLSKIAREITGTNWNGKLFFRVTGT